MSATSTGIAFSTFTPVRLRLGLARAGKALRTPDGGESEEAMQVFPFVSNFAEVLLLLLFFFSFVPDPRSGSVVDNDDWLLLQTSYHRSSFTSSRVRGRFLAFAGSSCRSLCASSRARQTKRKKVFSVKIWEIEGKGDDV